MADVEEGIEGRLLDSEVRRHSPRALELHKLVSSRLIWLPKRRGYASCGTPEPKQFIVYLNQGHEEPDGRWEMGRYAETVSARTVETYHDRLRTVFRWLVAVGYLPVSPMASM